MTMYSPYIESILRDLEDTLKTEPFTVGATQTKSSIAMRNCIKALAEYADDLEFDNTTLILNTYVTDNEELLLNVTNRTMQNGSSYSLNKTLKYENNKRSRNNGKLPHGN